jgi:hypothetical protein
MNVKRFFSDERWEAMVDALIEKSAETPWDVIPGYMERFWLVPYSRWRYLPAARVHHILRSDLDRHCHDHPWTYLTIILRGEYTEVTPQWDASGLYLGEQRRRHTAGSVLFRRFRSLHRLEVPKGTTTWTLFITGPYRQKWGFLVQPRNKVRYEEYLKRR